MFGTRIGHFVFHPDLKRIAIHGLSLPSSSMRPERHFRHNSAVWTLDTMTAWDCGILGG